MRVFLDEMDNGEVFSVKIPINNLVDRVKSVFVTGDHFSDVFEWLPENDLRIMLH